MRQIVLDTETTGLEVSQGHRIIEIGCVELVNRKLSGNHYHQYIQPDREIDQGAIEVHGITNEFLADKPRFAKIADDFYRFVEGAELVIHNAAFDVGFLDAELARLDQGYKPLEQVCSIVDSLMLARTRHPGQRNNLDALCQRYGVDNSQRDLHGALLDAEILADVYLALTGGQTSLVLSDEGEGGGKSSGAESRRPVAAGLDLPLVRASEQELTAHEVQLKEIEKGSGSPPLWRELFPG